jgi:Mannosylglycerate hydrolase MGH1-like glycoside hydrolase domain
LRWKKRAEHQLGDLLSQGVRDNRFFSPLDGKIDAPKTQSLLNYIPIVLGRRLPKKIRTTLIADLGPGGPFLTEWGLATESPHSPKYEPDGYWRGPIWAPSTYLIFDGLVSAGAKELAALIARRFCDLCAQDMGFWENYDALSGKGLRCPGYTWTASVFLLLARWLEEHDSPK